MKKSTLKKLIAECVSEILSEMSYWEEPEEKVYSNLLKWEKDNVDPSGKYIGEPLANYGFPYKVGDIIPKELGYRKLAMRNWNDAKKSRNNNLKLGRPIGFEEDITTRAELDKGVMKAVNLENEFDGKKMPKHNAKISKEEMEEAKTVASKIWQPVYLTTFHSTSLDGKHKFFEVRLHSATGDRHWMYKDEKGKWFYSVGYGVDSKFVPADEYLKDMHESVNNKKCPVCGQEGHKHKQGSHLNYCKKGHVWKDNGTILVNMGHDDVGTTYGEGEEMDEQSTTGGVAGYQTPFAFSKKGGSKKGLEASKRIGYKPVTKKDWEEQ